MIKCRKDIHIIKTTEQMKKTRGFNKNLVQAKNWLCSYRNLVTETKQTLERTLKIAALCTKFMPTMDEPQRKDMLMQTERLASFTEKANKIAEKLAERLDND